MTEPRIGGVFSGYGGLEMAVQAVLGGDIIWHAEFEPPTEKNPNPAQAAATILKHRWPDVPNLGDITTINWAAVKPVTVLCGGFPCFPAGTLIDTQDGYRPIETIRTGDSVKTHTGRYMPVVQLMRRNATDTIAVKIMGAPEFVTTREHPFYVRTKGRVWNNDRRRYDRTWTGPEWTAAAFLTSDSFVGFQMDSRDDAVPALGAPLAHLIGRWLGDGWVRNTARRSPVPAGQRGSRINSQWWHALICCAHDEAPELEALIRAAGFEPHAPQINRTSTRFRIGSEPLVKLLSEFGSGAAGKRIPGWVYRLPVEDQRALWQGWVDSDGSTQKNGQVRVTTVSEQLAHGMARIARNVYRRAVSVHHSPMPATCVIEGRTVNQRDQYQVVLPVANREAFIDGDWCWVPVRSVVSAEPAEVYNFGVAEDESYTAWGLAVHNCQDLSQAGSQHGMTPTSRSGLWSHFAYAISQLHPKLVVIENVRGLLTARGAEPTGELLTAWAERDRLDRIITLINRKHSKALREGKDFYVRQHATDRLRFMGRHRRAVAAVRRADARIVRAIGTVLGDLARLGYDAQWHGLRAADVGAPHERFRVFIVAYPTGEPWSLGNGNGLRVERAGRAEKAAPVPDTSNFGHERGRPAGHRRAGPADSDRDAVPDADGGAHDGQWARPESWRGSAEHAGPEWDGVAVPDTSGTRREGSRPEPERGGPERSRSGAVPDAERGGRDGRAREQIGRPLGRVAAARDRQDAVADSERTAGGQHEPRSLTPSPPQGTITEAQRRAGRDSGTHSRPPLDWGNYGPAVARWERALGRVAPAPTELAPKGGQRLAPAFVEWMMGLPAGHVTDPAIGISRNAQLKALGNGVVPQQAAAAVWVCLTRAAAQKEAA